jgi:hypothetical protein
MSSSSYPHGASSVSAAITPSTQIPGGHSKEDLATAALLHSFNQSDDRYQSPATTVQRTTGGSNEESDVEAGATAKELRPSEVPEYHSLEDAVRYQHISGAPHNQTSTQNFGSPARSAPGTPSGSGQVCR